MKITKKLFLKALKNSSGNQSRIADRMEVTRSAVGHFLTKHPKMRVELEEQRMRLAEISEDNLATNIMVHGSIDDSKWFLLNSKEGKGKGYGQKQEVEHTGDKSMTINLITKSNEEIKKLKDLKK
jgi:predicted transcriptional regulator